MHLIFKILATILIFILMIAFVLLFYKFRVIITYTKNQNEKLSFGVYLLLFRGRIKVFPIGKAQKKSTEKSDELKSDNSESIINKIVSYSKIISDIKNAYRENKDFIRNKLIAEDIYVYIKFGLSDAMQTGIATGALWAALYQIFAFLCYICTVRTHKFEIDPVYDNTGFCSTSRITLSFRAINIIKVIYRVKKTYNKVKNKNTNLKGGDLNVKSSH